MMLASMSAPSSSESFLDPARLSPTDPPSRYSHWPTWCLFVPLLVCAPILYAAGMAALAGLSPEQALAAARRQVFFDHLPVSGLALMVALLPVAFGLLAWRQSDHGEPGNVVFVRWRLLVLNYTASALGIAVYCTFALFAESLTLRGFALLTGVSVVLLWISIHRAAYAEHRFARHLEAQIEKERQRFASLRLLKQGLAHEGRQPTRIEIERRARDLGVGISFEDYLHATTTRTRYLDVIKRTLDDFATQGDAQVSFVRAQVQRICLAGLILKSDVANELLGVISRTVLRLASLVAIFAMALMLVLGFKNIIQALYSETASKAPAIADLAREASGNAESLPAASQSSITLKSAIKAVEYLLLAAMPYLLLVSLTRYMYSLTAKDPDVGSTPAEIKMEQAEVKAYWVSLLIGVLVASLIEQTLDPMGMLGVGQRQKALVVCLLIAILVVFFLCIKLTGGKGEKATGQGKTALPDKNKGPVGSTPPRDAETEPSSAASTPPQ